MKYLFPVLSPFFIGWILALIVYPIGEKLSRLTVSQKVHLTRERAGGVVILLFAGLAIFLLWEAMETCANRVPGWLSCLPDLKDEMNYFLANCCDHLEKITGILSEDSQGFVVKQMTAAEEAFLQGGGLEFWGQAVDSVKKCIVFFGGAFLSVLSSILFLRDLDEFREKLQGYSLYVRIHNVCIELWSKAKKYILAQLRIMGIIGLLCLGGFYLLHVKHFILWGIGLGLLDALPLIGTGTVLIPWSVLEFFQGNTAVGAGLLALYLVTSLARQFLEPKLVGESLGIYPIFVLLTIYLGVYLYGGLGFLLGPVSALLIWGIIKEWDLLSLRKI